MEHRQTSVAKTVIIAGGTGMIGKILARKFYYEGWNVTVVSRKDYC